MPHVKRSVILSAVAAVLVSCTPSGSPPNASLAVTNAPPVYEAGVRDPLLHPFASTSPWNYPIGDGAVYVDAELKRSPVFGVFVEEEVLILRPDAPLTAVFESHADWKKGADRSKIDGPEITQLPVPTDFVTTNYVASTPNHAAAVLMADGRTLHNSQPFHRGKAGGPATSHYVFPETDMYGDGMGGAHGGSGLSALGGTIRLGELVPGGEINHTLKIVMHSKWFAYQKDGTPGYRWPATKADGHASRWTYKGDLAALEMGALFALKPDFDIESLQTEPGKILARAFRDYGAYLCDTAGWDAYYLSTEWSPEGRVIDEFEAAWGYSYVMKDLTHPWSQDFARIIEALHVIDNNGPTSIGGGGVPRKPLSPPLREP